jgi:hypothetical protein
MPTIHDFGRLRICIYFDDHNPPHFHVVSPEEEVLVSLESMEVVAGSMNRKSLSQAMRWAAANRDVLAAKWDEYNGGQRP